MDFRRSESLINLSLVDFRRLTEMSGHCRLNSHLYKIRRISDPSCPYCGETSESVTLFLCECQGVGKARKDVFGRNLLSPADLKRIEPQKLLRLINASGRLKAWCEIKVALITCGFRQMGLQIWSDYKTIKAANQNRASSLWRPANTDQQHQPSAPTYLALAPVKITWDLIGWFWWVLAVYTQGYYSKSRSKIVGTNRIQILGGCRLVLIDGWAVGQVPALAVLAVLTTAITKCTKLTCFEQLNSLPS